MSSQISVPDSNVKLKDGSVVMLKRFPGTKWIVHNGWYSYNGRNYTGWYFSSVPAQTVIPVNQYDLQGIVVVANSDGSGSTKPTPEPVPMPDKPFPDFRPWYDPDGTDGPNPGYPVGPGPFPGPFPGPNPHDKFGPNPFPPMPPGPCPDKPVMFTRSMLDQLNSAFITVEKVKDFEAIDTEDIPDGRYVCVNSVDGKRKYYRWNKRDDRWDEVDPVAIIDEEIDYALESYTTTEDMQAAIDTAKQEVVDIVDETKSELQTNIDNLQEQTETAVSNLSDRITENSDSISSLSEHVDEVEAAVTSAIEDLSQKELDDVETLTGITEVLQQEIDEIRTVIDDNSAEVTQELEDIKLRLTSVEEAVFNVKRLAEVLGDNTILVSNEGGISDSGISIGDDNIGEIADYADSRTVATERAVAELVERSQTRWTSF